MVLNAFCAAAICRSPARVCFSKTGRAVLAETPGGVSELVFENLVLATGARERFCRFPVGLAECDGRRRLAGARRQNGLPIERKKVVVGTGPLLLAVAAYLRAHGAEVLLIAEQASSLRE